MAIEEVFFSANAKSALKLGQVRGVAMLAAANCGKPVVEYAPLSIKSAVVGYGLAAKDAGAVHGDAAAGVGADTGVAGRRRRVGDRDLPHPDRADAGAAARRAVRAAAAAMLALGVALSSNGLAAQQKAMAWSPEPAKVVVPVRACVGHRAAFHADGG